MNFEEARDLLWLSVILYGSALATGFALASRVGKIANFIPFILILCGFIAQTQGLGIRGRVVGGCPLGNGLELIQFILWSVVFGYIIIRVLFRLNLLGLFAAGFATIGGTISLLLKSIDEAYWQKEDFIGLFANHWMELHASVAIFSYGIFGLLAVVSAMYMIQQNALQAKHQSFLAAFLPSIHQLETAGARLLLVGVVFLTGSIVVGSLHWIRSPESVSSMKVALTVSLWLAYCSFWYLHFRQKLYGKKFAKSCIALFVVALLSLGVVRNDSPNPRVHNLEDVN